jgi:hypothetical protein
LFEREVFSEIGYFDESLNYAEDWDFYLRFISKFEIALLPQHLANYHIRPTARDIYGNTVRLGIDAHKLVAAALRNDLIRRDIASGKFGLGFIVALTSRSPFSGQLKHILWNKRKRILARLNPKAISRRYHGD